MNKQIFLISLLFISFLSCNKDDDSSINSAQAVGTWNMTSFSCTNGAISGTFSGIPVSATFTLKGSNYNVTNTFNSNGTYSTKGKFTLTTETRYSGQSPVSESEDTDIDESGTWVINGNKLTLTSGGESQEFTITELSSTKFTVSQVINEKESDPSTGIDLTTSGTVITSFSK